MRWDRWESRGIQGISERMVEVRIIVGKGREYGLGGLQEQAWELPAPRGQVQRGDGMDTTEGIDLRGE